MKYLKLSFFLLLVISSSLFLAKTQTAIAQTMSNDDFIIRMGNLNMSAGKPAGSGFQVNFTAGQTSPGLYSKTGVNYKVRAGFQYISSIIPFTFSVSNSNIDFGSLSATNPVTRTNLLTVSNGSAHGYQVTASQNHQLLVPPIGATIPDTTCDNGLCTPSNSEEWSSSLTFGFGYRCDNISDTDCSTDFASANFYKPFASSPSAEVVMTGSNVGRNKQSQITYKVNISGTQPSGVYSNIIMYIATPTF